MHPTFTNSPTWISLRGETVPEAGDRQRKVPGFDQDIFSRRHVVCIGAGGIVSHIAPTLVRKGVGRITLLDPDTVEPSNLNRQRFYVKDLYRNKAHCLAENLQRECINSTHISAGPVGFEDAVADHAPLSADVAICGVDNNPARVSVSRYYRAFGVPVVFTAVSRDADHGYAFVQDRTGPCLLCLFPDIVNDDRYPCPGTPAIADILQAVGSLAVYALDTLLMPRPRSWNYRRISLSDGALDGAGMISVREGCPNKH